MSWKSKAANNKKQHDETQKIFSSVTDGLKTIYKTKIRPLEVYYRYFNAFS